ncbi:hypothetical protein ACFLV1_01645 [Chloroflexota bacterium]
MIRGKRLVGFLVLVVLAPLFISACADFQQFPTPTPTEPAGPEIAPAAAAIGSGDKAILAVYEHLLASAGSHEAKEYLADFYTAADNWTAEMERFKDGSSVWNVAVDMTAMEVWEWPPYWRQASWYVYRDGEVIPSNRYQGNALRIEAELQKLSRAASVPTPGS